MRLFIYKPASSIRNWSRKSFEPFRYFSICLREAMQSETSLIFPAKTELFFFFMVGRLTGISLEGIFCFLGYSSLFFRYYSNISFWLICISSVSSSIIQNRSSISVYYLTNKYFFSSSYVPRLEPLTFLASFSASSWLFRIIISPELIKSYDRAYSGSLLLSFILFSFGN